MKKSFIIYKIVSKIKLFKNTSTKNEDMNLILNPNVKELGC